ITLKTRIVDAGKLNARHSHENFSGDLSRRAGRVDGLSLSWSARRGVELVCTPDRPGVPRSRASDLRAARRVHDGARRKPDANPGAAHLRRRVFLSAG